MGQKRTPKSSVRGSSEPTQRHSVGASPKTASTAQAAAAGKRKKVSSVQSSSPAATASSSSSKKDNPKNRATANTPGTVQPDGAAASSSTSSKSESKQKKTFADLGVCETLCDSCAEVGYSFPTPIQRESIPYALQGRDVIALAETGSGKTAAFALPILQQLLATPQRLFALCLAPTRELAFQISEQFEALGAGIGLKSCVIVGGVDVTAQQIALSQRPHVIVATPGRILYHLEHMKGFSLSTLKYLVLDEADRLLNMDFEKEINDILRILPKTRRTFLFSATMTQKVAKLQRASLSNPVKVSVSSSKYQTVQTLVQNYIFIPAKHKDCYLAYILNEYSGHSIIVFVGTCHTALRLTLMLRNLGFPVVPLHGKMQQSKRLGALNKFKSGERRILIATDVASRGLDIPSVDIVLNVDIPSNSKDYIHRVGRTARAGSTGRSITFVTQYDVGLFQKIEALTQKKMDLYPYDADTVLLLLDRVMEAQRFAAMELKEIEATKKGGKGGRKREDADDLDTEEGGSGRVKKRFKKKRT